MKRNLLILLGSILVALFAFVSGYFIGYQKAEKDFMEYIHRDVPDFEDAKENTDPVI